MKDLFFESESPEELAREFEGENETFNLTPSWEGLLPSMLILYKQYLKKKANARLENSSLDRDIAIIEESFRKMAIAADLYNNQNK